MTKRSPALPFCRTPPPVGADPPRSAAAGLLPCQGPDPGTGIAPIIKAAARGKKPTFKTVLFSLYPTRLPTLSLNTNMHPFPVFKKPTCLSIKKLILFLLFVGPKNAYKCFQKRSRQSSSTYWVPWEVSVIMTHCAESTAEEGERHRTTGPYELLTCKFSSGPFGYCREEILCNLIHGYTAHCTQESYSRLGNGSGSAWILMWYCIICGLVEVSPRKRQKKIFNLCKQCCIHRAITTYIPQAGHFVKVNEMMQNFFRVSEGTSM